MHDDTPRKPGSLTDARPRVSNETYFFRDHGQFDLLRLRLLPELIARNAAHKTLRLWSAGCASGEEAYSLAMLVDMLMPQRAGWDIRILGADIDAAVLAHALRGCYREWSFRMVPAQWRQRYFQREGDVWRLDERIRRMVEFRAIDLVAAAYPDDELRDMDLILCRNVFIYFDRASVGAVADKLAQTLGAGGYLMTGHTELMGYKIKNIRNRLFAEGVVHQRCAAAAPVASPVASLPAALPPLPVLPVVSRIPVSAKTDAASLLAAARQAADGGEYVRAAQLCHETLVGEPLAAGAYFLLAQLAQLDGDFAQAEQLLEKTLYLEPGNVAACLELAALCERTERLPRAQALRRAALDSVRQLPADAVIEPYEASAAELARWLAQ